VDAINRTYNLLNANQIPKKNYDEFKTLPLGQLNINIVKKIFVYQNVTHNVNILSNVESINII
jgi:hypothetical protein